MAAKPLDIPPSNDCVDVKIIDTTAHLMLPLSLFAHPNVGDIDAFVARAYNFLIENPRTHERVIFDLGCRKDWQNLAPSLSGRIRREGWTVDIKKNVVEIIQEHGVDPSSINSVIWSHHHFDHTGDPSTFPSTTELVVGPDFKKKLMPGYPADPEGVILEADYKDRELREISFGPNGDAPSLKIGDFGAFDFFGDGSFYLLDTPGHAIGHMCGLVRTTPDSFLLLGGDSCHHLGTLRPTSMLPLPENIDPDPLDVASAHACPCSIFTDLHPKRGSRTEPFLTIAPSDGDNSAYLDSDEANRTLDKLKVFDADERVFITVAHDKCLASIVDLFPESANEWREKGWKEQARWRFLADFKHPRGSELQPTRAHL